MIIRKNGSGATAKPLVSAAQLIANFDLHVEFITRNKNGRIANLMQKIPAEYPWQDFLEKHFSSPPFELSINDCERILTGNANKWQIREARKPSTFFSVFRFLEFFRLSIAGVQEELPLLIQLIEKLNIRMTGSGKLLAPAGDQGSNRLAEPNLETADVPSARSYQLEHAKQVLDSILTRAVTVTHRSDQLIEPFYHTVVKSANDSFTKGALNLFHLYPVKTMAMKLFPHYEEAMTRVIELRAIHLKINGMRRGG